MNLMHRAIYSTILLVLCLMAGGVSISFAATPLIKEARFWTAPDHTRAVLDLSAGVEYRAYSLPNPERVVVDMPEFGVIDTVRSLLAAFDEKEQLLHLMEQVEKDEHGVRVFIGSEHAMVDMEQVSMVMARYKGPMNTIGTLGVIGPRRMQYDRVLQVVDCTARLVSRILGGRT